MVRVLLIDDDPTNLEFMRQLVRLEGHELACAGDGKQGIALARQIRPDLIICDILMPHLGGYAVLETVRADPELAHVPVMLFSAAMNEQWRAAGLSRGANEALAKPFDLELWRNAIRRCLGQGQE